MSQLAFSFGNVSSISLSENKNVTCLSRRAAFGDKNSDIDSIKCIRVGTGWSNNNRRASFSIGISNESSTTGYRKPEVTVYLSDEVTILDNDRDFEADKLACLNGTISAPSNWDDMFSDLSSKNASSILVVIAWYGSRSRLSDLG